MNSFLKIVLLIISIPILGIGSGCAKRTIWIADPGIKGVRNPFYEAQLEPLKTDKNFFYYFQVTIFNKTDAELKIDWNKTQYLRNGTSKGVFIFQGINPDDIKNLTIPYEIVPVGERLIKRIAPYELVAWNPYRSKSESRINPGIIPAGRNGILLVILVDGEEVIERIEVDIKEKEAE